MKRYTTIAGAVLIAFLCIIALAAPWLAPHDPGLYHLERAFGTPQPGFWFGLDADGRDIFSRILYGARVSLGIAFTVSAVSLVVGSAAGLIAGLLGGWTDRLFLFVSDVFLAFPSFLFALAVAAFLHPSVFNVILLLTVKGWVGYARLVRGQTLALKEREFILAARAIGVPAWRVCLKHLLPNMVGVLAVNVSFGMAGVIIIESALSFLGLGVPLDVPSWGNMLDEGTQYLLVAPHISIFPGIFIMLVVLGFNFLGDGLRDKLAPRGK